MEHAADALLAHEGVQPPAGPRVCAPTKVVFEYADSDDDEGTTAVVRNDPADGAMLAMLRPTDFEDPVEAAKMAGDIPTPDRAASHESSDVEFTEDATPAAMPNVAAAAFYGRVVDIPLADRLVPPQAPSARTHTLRVHRGEAAATTDQLASSRPIGGDDEEAAAAAGADVALPPRKRDRDVKVTSEGYHLTVDERDLVADLGLTGVTRALARRREEQEGEEEAAKSAGVALPSTAAADEGGETNSLDAPAAAGDEDNDVDDEDADEEDEEETEEDAMMDDLLLVASVEQMLKCCEATIPTLRGRLVKGDVASDAHRRTIEHEMEAMEALVREGRDAHKRLCEDDMSPEDFGAFVRPFMGRVAGALRRAARPPKADPIVVDGKTLDI